jgi:chromosome segregation ATPase
MEENHVDAAISQQQMQEHPITTGGEKSSAIPISSGKKAMIAAEIIILPGDDDADAIHTRHTFSSRQKMQNAVAAAAAAQRRNKSNSKQQQQQRKNNCDVVGTLISPLADETNVRHVEPRNCHTDSGNSDMKWSTIGNTKIPRTQELEKLTSLIPQPVSPECSMEEDEGGGDDEQDRVLLVSPAAASSVSHQSQQVTLSNFKTPMKTPPSPYTQLLNYYNSTNNNNKSSSSKDNSKPISPTTSFLLQSSPFKLSGKLLDDQLQSVLQADLSMDKKIEQMMLENDSDDDSYMGGPMCNLHESDIGDEANDANNDNDHKIQSKSSSRDESMSTISDAFSELSDEVDITHLHHIRSPDVKSDLEFLTPKSRLVANNRGRRTVATAYFTAENVVEGNNTRRESNEDSRMYDSDSESYWFRRMDVIQQQQQQQQQRPRSASFDAGSSTVKIIERERDVNTTTVLEKVRRNFMSPPEEFRTTRVLWSDDASPMKADSLNWEFDAEKNTSNTRALLAGDKMKSNNAPAPPTPVTYPVKRRSQQHSDVDDSAKLTSSVPMQHYSTRSSNKKNTISHACTLQLGKISEEQCGAQSAQSDSQVSSEREELLNLIHVMRIQLAQLETERDSLVSERDAHANDCNEYKMEREVLSAQVKTLKEEVQISLQVVENVKETLASKADETDCLKQLLQKRDEDLGSLNASLLSKEGEVEELSLAYKSQVGDLEARLQSAENEHLAEVARVTAEMKQVHSETIKILESDQQEVHAIELDCTKATLVKDFDAKFSELVATHAMEVEQMKASLMEELEQVRSEAEKDHLNSVDVMTLNHAKEMASSTESLNFSRLQAIEELKAAHTEEVKLLQDASFELHSEKEKLRKECDDLATQILSLEATNEVLTKALSTQEEEHRQAQEAATERELSSTNRYHEVEAMLQESNANLSLLRKHHEVLGETIANLEAKHTDLESAVQKKDAIITEMKRQLLDSRSDIDSITLANTALESKYTALLAENAFLKESNSNLNEFNTTLQTSLGEMSKDLSVALQKKEELVASLGDAKSNIQTLEDRITFIDSELVMKIQCIDQLLEEKKEASQRETDLSTQVNRLQSDVAAANEKNVKTTAELDALLCFEKEIRGQLEASDDEKLSLREEVGKLKSQLSEVKRDREHLSQELTDLSSLREEMFANSQSNETKISELASENRALSRVKNILQLKSDKFESLNATATTELIEHKKELTRLQDEKDLVNAELDRVKAKLVFESENKAYLVAEKSCVEVQLNATQQERDDLQRRLDEAVLSCESMSLSLEEARLQLQLKADEIESMNVTLTANLEEHAVTEADLKELRSQLEAESKTTADLVAEKSCVEVQLNATQQERDDLQRRLDEAVVSCESMLLSLEDARSHMHGQSIEIESRNASSAAELDAANKMIDVLREERSGVEARLSSFKLEKSDIERRFNEAIVSCESMLLSLEAARSHMQVKSAQLHELEVQLANKDVACAIEVSEKAKLMSSFAHQQSLAAKLAVKVLQLKMKSKNEHERSETLTTELELKDEKIKYLETCVDDNTLGEQNLKLTIAKLASALIKLKARERRAVTVQQTLSAKNIDYLSQLGVTAKENEGMKEGMDALTDKITVLELELDSSLVTVAELEKAVSVKDAELKRLSYLLKGNDEALRDVTNEMQKIRGDVMNGVKKLEFEHASAIKACSHLEEELEGVNTQLGRERELVFILQSQLDQIISEKNDFEDDMVDLQGTQLHLENRLEQVSQDRNHLKTQIEDLHDTIAALESDKDSLTMKLEEFEEQAEHFKTKIASLEADAKSKARQIDYMEFQLVSKMDESEALNKMVVSQEATLKDLNDEIEAMDAKKTVAEESLSSLNLKMDAVINERDGLASELQSTVKELESLRGELNLIRSGTDSLSHSSSSSELDSSQDMDNFSSSREGIRKILESSKITREDIDFICSSMDKAKATITELGKERKTLKKEVKRLRAALEQSQGELKTVKKNCKVMNQQTISLRGDVNQAKSLLKENEAEKNRLSSALQAAHEAMDEIHRCSSESYNALVHQSQHEISMLKSELESKDEAIEQLHALHNEHVSKFDITSDSIQSSQPSVVTSAERFKVEKGQSMLGILKGRRTKRKDKDQLSYRKKK